MNNILISLKRFISNKNVVTVIGVIAILGLLYWGYTSTIKRETKPMEVPVAAQTIQPRTKITDDMVTYVTVPEASVSSNVLKYNGLIVGKCADVNTVIPAGSMFYSDVLVDEKELPDSAFVEVPEGQRPYALKVDIDSTYGNSIFPGNMIDVFMKAEDENQQIMVGRLLQDVKVLAVKDSEGNNVFENTDETRTPSTLTFAVPEDVYILLKKAEYLQMSGVELFPAPRGGNPVVKDALTVDRAELVSFIESKSITFKDDTTENIDENQNIDGLE